MKRALLLFLLFVTFVSKEAISQCGEISLIGEFSSWSGDHWMTQDPVNLDIWTTTISLNQASNTENDPDIVAMKFRADTAWAVNWGAADFPKGTGTQDGPNIPVPIDTAAFTTDYFVTFNCATGEYDFANVSVTAVRAYAMTIDGILDEPEWNLNRAVSKVISGTVTADSNEVHFGVAFDDNNLYVGLNVKDAFPTLDEMGEIFIDGDNSGGPYDSHDLHLRFNGPVVTIIQGPPALVTAVGFGLTADGYAAELSIPFVDFGIVPGTETQIGFDIIFGDGDAGTGVDYMMSWVGGLENYTTTDSFGTLVFADFTGVNEYQDYSSYVELYPNPSSGDINLNLSNDFFNGVISVSIDEITGREIYQDNINLQQSGKQVSLEVNQLKPGIYFVNIYGENGAKAVKKLIIK